jgi:tripartite-type tricarboxylate transporter receptor subunit TctC
VRKLALITMLALGSLITLAACGGDEATPTPTQPAATATPTAMAAIPTPTAMVGADPTPTPRAPAATPTPTGRDMAAYFEGQTIRIVVGFSPGGGYDTVSRIFASVAPKYFPGNPRFIIANQPGSGGLRALQTVTKADPDGFSVTPMASRFIIPEVIGNDVEGFDLFTATMIGTPTFTSTHQSYCVRRDLATSWEEMKAAGTDWTIGTSSAGGDDIGPALLEYLGEPMKVIFGYGGTSEVLAAVDRGELDGTTRCDFNFIEPLFPEWIANDTVVPVYWWRTPISSAWLEAIGATEPPNLWDIAPASAEQRLAFEFGDTAQAMTRMFTMAPGIPEDVVAVWRTSFEQVLEDPDFLRLMDAANLAVGYGDPDLLLSKLDAAKAFTDEGKDLLRTLYPTN